ncbi:MAG: GNAT family N-acetyltransferase [Saprospiraceae bacterium]|nr:GNAT family N-acetyltransferase [Saprospiraceae bacterium]
MIRITQGELRQAYDLSMAIPEFQEPYTWQKWQERLTDADTVALVAYVQDQPAGFKVGYGTPAFFYSWIGGVLPDYRGKGVARALADEMEQLIAGRYDRLRMKTRNRYKAMLQFAIGNGFNIVEVRPATTGHPVLDLRIVLEKNI